MVMEACECSLRGPRVLCCSECHSLPLCPSFRASFCCFDGAAAPLREVKKEGKKYSPRFDRLIDNPKWHWDQLTGVRGEKEERGKREEGRWKSLSRLAPSGPLSPANHKCVLHWDDGAVL